MSRFIIVFAAGGLGCVLRYAVGLLFINPHSQRSPVFPWHTLAANLAACLIIALGAFLLRDRLNPTVTLLITAFCGGLSTFSAFSLETITLINRGLFATAFVYVFISLIFCFLTIWLVSRMA